MAKFSVYEPVVRHAKDVTTEPIRWLWEPYIPRDMLMMLDGDPGIGKSTLIAQLATQLSNDWPFLDQTGKPTLHADIDGPQHTVILSAEDSLSHILVPRLQKAGADIGYIHFFEGMKDAKGNFIPFSLQHLNVLVKTIQEIQPALVVLDPLVAYLGDIDMHRSNQTRPLMTELAKAANEYHCTFMGIRHPSKLDQGGPLMYRGQGNMDIVGAARSALWVQKHPTHPETQSLMIHSKSNVGIPGRSVTFSREHGSFHWVGVTRLREDMFTGKGPEPYAFLDAFFWLEEYMTPGKEYPLADIDGEAEKQSISQKILSRAKKALGIRLIQRKKPDETGKTVPDYYNLLPPLTHIPHTHHTTTSTGSTEATGSTGSTGLSELLSTAHEHTHSLDSLDSVDSVDSVNPVDPVLSESTNGHHPDGFTLDEEAYTCPCGNTLADNQQRCFSCGEPRSFPLF